MSLMNRDKKRMEWLRNMHTLHVGVRFLYCVSTYTLFITYDDDAICEYESDENLPDLDLAWANVIDKAMGEWKKDREDNHLVQ